MSPPRAPYAQNLHTMPTKNKKKRKEKPSDGFVLCIYDERPVTTAVLAANAASAAASCSALEASNSLTTFPSPGISFLTCEPEKQNFLDFAGAQSRAEVANDQLKGRKHPLIRRGKTNKRKRNNIQINLQRSSEYQYLCVPVI